MLAYFSNLNQENKLTILDMDTKNEIQTIYDYNRNTCIVHDYINNLLLTNSINNIFCFDVYTGELKNIIETDFYIYNMDLVNNILVLACRSYNSLQIYEYNGENINILYEIDNILKCTILKINKDKLIYSNFISNNFFELNIFDFKTKTIKNIFKFQCDNDPYIINFNINFILYIENSSVIILFDDNYNVYKKFLVIKEISKIVITLTYIIILSIENEIIIYDFDFNLIKIIPLREIIVDINGNSSHEINILNFELNKILISYENIFNFYKIISLDLDTFPIEIITIKEINENNFFLKLYFNNLINLW